MVQLLFSFSSLIGLLALHKMEKKWKTHAATLGLQFQPLCTAVYYLHLLKNKQQRASESDLCGIFKHIYNFIILHYLGCIIY